MSTVSVSLPHAYSFAWLGALWLLPLLAGGSEAPRQLSCPILGEFSLLTSALTGPNFDGLPPVDLPLQPTPYDVFQGAVLENRMALEDRIPLMGNKLDEVSGVASRAFDNVRLSAAPAIDAVGVIAPLVHTWRSDATLQPVVGTLLFRDTALLKWKPDRKTIALGHHCMALDSLPFKSAKSHDLNYFGNSALPKFGQVLSPLLGLQDSRAESHTVVCQRSFVYLYFLNATAIGSFSNRKSNPSRRLPQEPERIRVLALGVMPQEHNLFQRVVFHGAYCALGACDATREADYDATAHPFTSAINLAYVRRLPTMASMKESRRFRVLMYIIPK